MVLFFVFVCVFLIIQIGQVESSTELQLQRDSERIIRIELGEGATLRFNDSFSNNNFFLSNWIIWGPYNTTIYGNSSHELPTWQRKDIEKCIAETDSSLTVTLSKFGRRHVGKWRVDKEYRELGNYWNIMLRNISFSVDGIEFERRYHRKSFKIREGEYVVMNFDEEYLKYSVCNLIKIEPNRLYDLDAELYRFPKGHAGIKRLDPCGFRMHVENSSNGNWFLVGRFGYIQKRAYFEVVIDSSTSRPPKKLTSPLQFGWIGFPIRFELNIDSPYTYWELEKPDGNILNLRNKSPKYMDLVSITSDDNGTWIARAALNSDVYLTEQKFIIRISDFPAMLCKSKNIDSKHHDLYVDANFNYDIELCIFISGEKCVMGQKKNTVDNCIEQTCWNRWSFYLQSEDSSSLSLASKLIFRMTYFFSRYNSIEIKLGIPIENDFQLSEISHVWPSVQRRIYVTYGESFNVTFPYSILTEFIMLISPKHETYTQTDSSNFFCKNCPEEEEDYYCGCVMIVESATESHNGIWKWTIILEGGNEVESIVPITVLESGLVSYIKPVPNVFWNVSLGCVIPPLMYEQEVTHCEWFRPDRVRLSENNSMQYDRIQEEYGCFLRVLGKENFGIWKCIVRLGLYPRIERSANLNLSKQLFEVAQLLPLDKSWPTFDVESEQVLEDDGTVYQQKTIYIKVCNKSRFCTIKDQSGKFFDATRMIVDEYSRWYFQLNIIDVPNEVSSWRWQVLFDNGDDSIVTTDVIVENNQFRTMKDAIYFLHTLPEMVVLKRGKKFENNYRAGNPLRSCTLQSPSGVKYDQYTHFDENSVRVVIDEGNSSCWIVLNDVTDKHSGNWFLEMKTTTGLESRDSFPIQVIESYIVLEAEHGIHPNKNIKLHCRRRTMMYDVKIRNCKWFRPGGRLISGNESMKYNTTEEYDVCSLELRDSTEDDFGNWNCSAGVDGYDDEEIAMLNLSKTPITTNKHYEKQEIGMDHESNIKSTKLRMMIGDAVEFICSASIMKFWDRIEWRYSDSARVSPSERIKINELPRTPTHYRSMLSINPTSKSDNRTYICSTILRGSHTHTSSVSTSYEIEFRDIAPFFVDTNMNKTEWKYNVNITNPEHIILKCYADGLPKPVIVWDRDGMKINDGTESGTNFCNATFMNQNQELHIDVVDVKCSGRYHCQAKNNMDVIDNYQTIEIEQQNNFTINTFTEKSSEYHGLIILSAFIFILICSSIITCYCLSERMHLKKKIAEVESAMRLNETRSGPLNPEEMLHLQADFLPYDEKRWEYPEKDLEMEEQLGHGFFGIVMKAEAPNINGDGKPHTVAVKKLEQSDSLFSNDFRALEIELRILANLEKHPNVVNLLGACTKRAAIGHLMVILEYCPLGNLLNYLRQNSSTFIDQIDPLSRTIVFPKENSFEILSIDSGLGTSGESIKDDTTVMKTTIESNPRDELRNGVVLKEGQNYSKNSDSVEISQRSINTEDTHLCKPAFNVNDTDVNNKFISTHHLLTWAFQTACAMEYLSSKKILHGDLAARNILLTEHKVAKICDFGLARTMPEGHYYRKVDAMMPLKWMAIESIGKQKYSTQSDVWSFGIVLWEIFTLGKHPYAGLNANKLIAFLCSGKRLEMPIYATEVIYEMMLRCWNRMPEDRPSFRELVQDIEKIFNEREYTERNLKLQT